MCVYPFYEMLLFYYYLGLIYFYIGFGSSYLPVYNSDVLSFFYVTFNSYFILLKCFVLLVKDVGQMEGQENMNGDIRQDKKKRIRVNEGVVSVINSPSSLCLSDLL